MHPATEGLPPETLHLFELALSAAVSIGGLPARCRRRHCRKRRHCVLGQMELAACGADPDFATAEHAAQFVCFLAMMAMADPDGDTYSSLADQAISRRLQGDATAAAIAAAFGIRQP